MNTVIHRSTQAWDTDNPLFAYKVKQGFSSRQVDSLTRYNCVAEHADFGTVEYQFACSSVRVAKQIQRRIETLLEEATQ